MQIVKEQLEMEFGKINMSTTLCNYRIVFEFPEGGVRIERIKEIIEELKFNADISLI